MLNFGLPPGDEPIVEEGKVFLLEYEGEMEEVGVDSVAAAGGAAGALPCGIAVAVDAVVVGDLLACLDVGKRKDISSAVDGLYK